MLLLAELAAAAGNWSTEPLPRRIVVGESIARVIDELRAASVPLAYSSAMLPDELRVISTPQSRQVLPAVYEILRPHNLTLHEVDGVYIVGHRPTNAETPRAAEVLIRFRDAQTDAVVSGVRIDGLPDSALQSKDRSERSINVRIPPGRYPILVSAPGYVSLETSINAVVDVPQTVTLRLSPQNIPLTEVIVAASRYEMMRDAADTSIGIDRQSIMQTPDTGDDPIRAVQRLPGTASNGVSARPHLRGSTDRESGIVLDGHRLLNPFHVRDFQSLFSTIDVRAIDGMKVYTGGFPVQYGDLSGGLVLVESLTPEQETRNEFGLSVFNTSILSAGRIPVGDTEYVLSIRRGNLDLVLDEEFGEPSYYDAYGKLLFNLSPDSAISVNMMQIKDTVIIIPSADPDDREETTNDTRNSQVWVSWEQQWSDAVSSQTIVSISDFISGRHALIDVPEKIRGQLSDERTIGILRLNQDWNFALNDWHHVSWGGELQEIEADYNYRSSADYFGIYRDLPGQPNSQSRELAPNIDGDAIAFYLSDRWMINKRLIADLGVRWDKQNYTDTDDNGQFSPRASLLYRLDPKTSLRLSWGRYYQAQGPHELQVEDGLSRFFPAQHFDQIIFGVDYRIDAHYSLRAEAYLKTSKGLRPQFENLFDPLTVVPELEPDRFRISAQRADLRGIEISAAYEGDNGVDWWASYTLSRAEDTVDGRDVARSWDQRHAAQLGVSLSGEHWGFSAAAKTHSGWPMTDISLAPGSGSPVLVFGERNKGRYGDFFSLDMRLDYRRPIRIGYFNWFFEISNATNRNNQCCVDFDVAVDGDGNRLLDTTKNHWFPLLPATGILIEF